MRIGVFFGGASREREISFSGGRTVCENLDRALFEPVPIFVDSLGNFILLDYKHLFSASIRKFYPPADLVEPSDFNVYIESLGKLSEGELLRYMALVGQRIRPSDFAQLIDFALIAMHGAYGEDGNLQGMLEWYNIPYSGSGQLAASIGIDKIVQNHLIAAINGQQKKTAVIDRKTWNTKPKEAIFAELKQKLSLPLVMKAPHQGSSIGVSIIFEDDLAAFIKGGNQCFFIKEISKAEWTGKSQHQKIQFLQDLSDLNKGIGMPIVFEDDSMLAGNLGEIVYSHPKDLLEKLDGFFQYSDQNAILTSVDSEEEVLVEEFVKGREFTCGVLQDEDGKAIALLPSEIVKKTGFFDFEAKYVNNAVEEILVMQASDEQIRTIQLTCEQIFESLNFNVYFRIDGFLTADNQILLHDPNTVPGMSPTSFIFKQFAEIGLSPTQTITYLVRTSIAQRIRTGKKTYFLRKMLIDLDRKITQSQNNKAKKHQVGIILGGFGQNRENSLALAKQVFTRLSASAQHEPVLILLNGTPEKHQLHVLPVNLLFKDHIAQIEALLKTPKTAFMRETIQKTQHLAQKYATGFQTEAVLIDYSQLAKQVSSVFVTIDEEVPEKEQTIQSHLRNAHMTFHGPTLKETDYKK